jgi:ribosomal protein S12 methylthiotransferase accessory factor
MVASLVSATALQVRSDRPPVFFSRSGNDQISADSNGCAAGNTLEEAIIQGFLELVERDAYAIWWYNRLQRAEVDLDKLGDSYIRDLRAHFAALGRGLWVLDVTSDLSIPVVIAVSHWTEDSREYIEVAAGAHFDLRIATLRAMTELNQFLAIERMRRRPDEQTDHDGSDVLPLPLRKNAYVLPHGKAPAGRARFPKFASLDRREQVLACVRLVKRFGLDFLVLDQTRISGQSSGDRSGRGISGVVCRSRLYDVPRSARLRKRSYVKQINPLHPQPDLRNRRPARANPVASNAPPGSAPASRSRRADGTFGLSLIVANRAGKFTRASQSTPLT